MPRAAELVVAVPCAKPELVAGQIEIATPPCATVADACEHLAAGRQALAAAGAARGLRLMGAGAHPFAATEGELTPGDRYEAIARECGPAIRRQLVAALQIHVAVRPAERALAVYNALRGHLPELAGLAANAPFHGGRDTGLASVRPTLAELLPRQGVPPALASWDAYAAALAETGDPTSWWWELRPHPLLGTLEIRVPDSQATILDAHAVAEVAYGVAAWLAARHEAGEELGAPETAEIEQRRQAALRHGATREAGERIAALLDSIAPFAGDLSHARALLAAGGPARCLRDAAGGDARAATAYLASRFLAG